MRKLSTHGLLWKIWCNNKIWKKWGSFGGVLTSGKPAVSWGKTRIDIFVKGTDNALWHVWWNNDKISEWESPGGTLTSAPSLLSWGDNRIDVFARGTDN